MLFQKKKSIHKFIIHFCCFLFYFSSFGYSQTGFVFNANSTGNDGELNTGPCDIPTNDNDTDRTTTIDVGDSGIKHYTSINIEENCIVKFTPTGNGSSPVRLIVQGDVTIVGKIDVSSTKSGGKGGGIGGPGGYNGGFGSLKPLFGQNGFGPGGGKASIAKIEGKTVISGEGGTLIPNENNPVLQPLAGGSGGSGGSLCRIFGKDGGGGGGGAGAILIATNGTIRITGSIISKGGKGALCERNSWYGGSGADGTIHLIANEISGDGWVDGGYVLIETMNYSGSLKGSNHHPISFRQLSLDIAKQPSIEIASIGGETVIPGQQLLLPSSGEMDITIRSIGLSEGTEVIILAAVNRNSHQTTLILDSSGEATGTITIPSGAGLLTAYVSKSIQTGSLPKYNNEAIMYARLGTHPGHKSKISLFTQSGKKVPDGFIKYPEKYIRFK